MLASDIPSARFPLPFANGASNTYKTVPIPTASTGTSRASLTDGFPPQTFVAVGAGGTPPDGRDFNGLLFEVTGWLRWQQAGGPIQYDSAFSTAIGGYPNGAVLMSNPKGVLWMSTADNNTTNPDSGGANWAPLMPIKAPDPLNALDDTNFVTPAGLAEFYSTGPQPPDALYAQNGFYTNPGGKIDVWGRFSITGPNANLTVGFPASLGGGSGAFPTACWSVVVGGGNNTTAQDNQVTLVGSSITASGFQVRFVPTGTVTGTYMAVGN